MPENKLNIELKKMKKRLDEIGYKTANDDKTFVFKPTKKKEPSGKIPDPKKVAEREANRKASVLESRIPFEKKIVKYKETKQLPRWKYTTGSKDKAGEISISKKVMQAIDSKLVTRDEVADMFFPHANSQKEFDHLKIVNTRKLHEKINKGIAKKEGIDRSNFAQKVRSIMFRKHTWDVSNSMGQIVSGLIGSESLASKTSMLGKHNTEEFRTTIAKKMMDESNGKFGKIDKEMVKEIYTPNFYGQGAKGAMEKMMKIKGWDKETAEQFRDLYYNKLEEVVPELKQFRERIEKMISDGEVGSEMSFKTWDGTTIKLKLEAPVEGMARVKGKDIPMKATSTDLNRMSRALMPTIIQSIDASILKKIQAKTGIKATHDAFHTYTGAKLKAVKEAYLEEVTGIFKSNLLHDIMTDLGYKGKPLKSEKEFDTSKLDVSTMMKEEHGKNNIENVVSAENVLLDDGQLHNIERIIEEFMAGDNVHKLDAGQYEKKLATDAGWTDMSTRYLNDNPFAYQLASAHQRSHFDPTFVVPPPDKISAKARKIWIKKQEEIFDNLRARLEANPLMEGRLAGERRFTYESGLPIGDNVRSKTYQQILKEETAAYKVLFNNLPKTTQNTLKIYGKDYNRLKIKSAQIQKKIDTGVPVKADDVLDVVNKMYYKYPDCQVWEVSKK